MLRIEQTKSYKLPRYPQGLYYECPVSRSWQTVGGITSVALLALLASSCQPVGSIKTSPSAVTKSSPSTVIKPSTLAITGPPPVQPTMVTEREAQTVIDAVFARNGIKLEADAPFTFTTSDQKSVQLELDGFNKDLNVGYEYIYEYKDFDTFTSKVIVDLNKASKSSEKGPKIKTIERQSYYPPQTDEEAYKKIEAIIEDSITDLRSKGIN